MDHKALTKHLRGRLAHAGIPCRVRMNSYCGVNVVQVITTTYEARWTPEQLREMGLIAKCNGLTFSHGLEIDRDNMAQLTGANQFDFVAP